MKANRRRDTQPELKLRSELHRRGLRFRVDHSLVKEGIRVRPDVVFPRWRVAVFVDGCFWHRCPLHSSKPKANSGYWHTKLDENVRRDKRNTEMLEIAGWKVLRIWAHTAPTDAADLIEVALDSAQKG